MAYDTPTAAARNPKKRQRIHWGQDVSGQSCIAYNRLFLRRTQTSRCRDIRIALNLRYFNVKAAHPPEALIASDPKSSRTAPQRRGPTGRAELSRPPRL